jgi:peroxiredoxin
MLGKQAMSEAADVPARDVNAAHRGLATLLVASWLGPACTPAPLARAPAPAPPASSPSPLLGKVAPDFARPTLDGARFELSASRGHVAVLKFVAKYCAPCLRSLPAVERFHREHPELALVAIAEDESEDDARALASMHHLTFPVIHDPGNVLGGRYRVTELPVTFVVDRTGDERDRTQACDRVRALRVLQLRRATLGEHRHRAIRCRGRGGRELRVMARISAETGPPWSGGRTRRRRLFCTAARCRCGPGH